MLTAWSSVVVGDRLLTEHSRGALSALLSRDYQKCIRANVGALRKIIKIIVWSLWIVTVVDSTVLSMRESGRVCLTSRLTGLI